MLGRCSSGTAARAAGFTLIELMVTVVIVSILASIAVPSYLTSVRKSRRTEARTALLDLAAREERYLATNSAYSSTSSDLGYGTSGFPTATASGYYKLDVSITAPSSTAAAGFTATATAVPGTGQDKDTNCYVFQITQTGVQTSATSGGADTTATGGCWN